MSIAEIYDDRRERVAIQVFEKWAGDQDDPVKMAAVREAADMTFRGGICDLDWEEAALRYLREFAS